MQLSGPKRPTKNQEAGLGQAAWGAALAFVPPAERLLLPINARGSERR